jgi:hypothetical protein
MKSGNIALDTLQTSLTEKKGISIMTRSSATMPIGDQLVFEDELRKKQTIQMVQQDRLRCLWCAARDGKVKVIRRANQSEKAEPKSNIIPFPAPVTPCATVTRDVPTVRAIPTTNPVVQYRYSRFERKLIEQRIAQIINSIKCSDDGEEFDLPLTEGLRSTKAAMDGIDNRYFKRGTQAGNHRRVNTQKPRSRVVRGGVRGF